MVIMSKDKILTELEHWREARKRYQLTPVQIQMARELGVKPEHLVKEIRVSPEAGTESLGRRIELLFLERFGRTRPDKVVSLRELERETRERNADAKARKSDDKAARDHAEAVRVSLITINRLRGWH